MRLAGGAESEVGRHHRIGMAGEVGMDGFVRLPIEIALAVRDELEDRRHRVLLGVVRNPYPGSEAGSVGERNPAVLDLAERGRAFLGVRHRSFLSTRESGQPRPPARAETM